MKLTGNLFDLFTAFSSVAAKAYRNKHLLSCPILAKTSNAHVALADFIQQEKQREGSSSPPSRQEKDIEQKQPEVFTPQQSVDCTPQQPANLVSTSQPASLASQSTSLASQPTSVASQSADLASQPTSVASQPTSVASQPTSVASQSADLASQPTSVASQPTSVASQPSINTGKQASTGLKSKVTAWSFLIFLQVLRISMRYVLTNFGHLFFLFFIKISTLILGWKIPKELTSPCQVSQQPLLIIDTFALLPQTAQEGRYQEMYMPFVAEQAQAMGYIPVRLYRLYGSRNPTVTWKSLSVFSLSGKGMTEVHLLHLCDWLALLWHIIVYPIALIRLIGSLQHYPLGSAKAAIREALIATAGQCILGGESRRLAGKRLGKLMQALPASKVNTSKVLTEQKYLTQTESVAHKAVATSNLFAGQGQFLQAEATAVSKVLSWYENQAIDKTFIHGFKQAQALGASKTPIIGAQLFLFSPALLNCYADDAEIALNINPDTIAVTGPYFLPTNSKQHYGVGPALRYQHIFTPFQGHTPSPQLTPYTGPLHKKNTSSGALHKKNAPNEELTLLVILSYHPNEITLVLRFLQQALQSPLPFTKILYKFHPATSFKNYQHLLPATPNFAPSSLTDSFAMSAVVLGSASGALPEAVCLQKPVIVIANPTASRVSTPLPSLGQNELWAEIAHPEKLQPALQKLTDFQKHPEYAQRLHDFTHCLFTEPTPKNIQRFIENL